MILLAPPLAPRAEDIRSLVVTRELQQYTVNMDVRLAADATRAFAVFSDPSQLTHLNPTVRAARVLREPGATSHPDAQQLYTELRVCAGPFCKTLRQVQWIELRPLPRGGHMHARVIPERSNLRFGEAQWDFSDCAGTTCLRFDAQIEPAFWVPPLIGPWLIERELRAQARITARGIERLAASAP